MKKFLAFSFCVAVALGLSNPLSAQAQAASGVKGICGFGSARLFNLLVRQKVIDQYTAVEVGCTVELPVAIKVSYTPADGSARKTVTDVQMMKFQGFFK